MPPSPPCPFEGSLIEPGAAAAPPPRTLDSTKLQPFSFATFLKKVGPGLVTGASDDDPSGIGTYAMAGATLGYATLWTALVTFPLMAAVQYICAKIGLVSGGGLARVLQRHYSRALVYPVVLVLLVANTINAGVDIGAIATGLNLLVPIPFLVLVVPITLAILALQIWGSYRLIANIFKWLTLSLFAYVGSAFYARPDAAAVLRGTFVPQVSLNHTYLVTLVAILGTTISPYLFFWQANHEAEEKRSLSRRRFWRRGTNDNELRYAFWDVNAGMLCSNVVMYFIILATAATLHQAGQTEIQSAQAAAEALRPLAGKASSLLLTLGLVGSGLLAVPILTGSSAYAVGEALGWKCGLNEKPGQARAFYAVIVLSTVAGALINYVGVNPMAALYWTAVLNGLLAPPLLVVILFVANNRKVMGERVNGRLPNALGWATALLMFAAGAGLFLT